jgi:hypothetical protein
LALLRRLAEWGAQAEDYGAIGELFRQVNVKLFARFQAVPVKKRVLNKLAGGVVTFGSSAPPIEIYQGPMARRKITGPAAQDAAGPVANEAHTILKPLGPGQERESLGNVSRGDWIRTSDLLNPIQDWPNPKLQKLLRFQLLHDSTLSMFDTLRAKKHRFLCKSALGAFDETCSWPIASRFHQGSCSRPAGNRLTSVDVTNGT